MDHFPAVELDVVIFGGGAAGLWLLDDLHRNRFRTLLLEANELGSGQTVASQGIIHGGVKYSLEGLLTPSSETIRQMPTTWRQCLNGAQQPDLQQINLRSDYCHLWHTGTLQSRLTLLGARKVLQVAPVKLDRPNWPKVLKDCPGPVYRLDEQVIDPASMIAVLASAHQKRMLKINDQQGLTFEVLPDGHLASIRLHDAHSGMDLELRARYVVLTAGAGNGALRRALRLSSDMMQRRPLHMVMLRGCLPQLYGHCTDQARTRVTISTAIDQKGRTIWQVGGQVAEDGVSRDPPALIRHARRELAAVLPGLDLAGIHWGTYKVDRAEGTTADHTRPKDVSVWVDANIITAWPTKLALVPRLAAKVGSLISQQDRASAGRLHDNPQHQPPEAKTPDWKYAFNAPSSAPIEQCVPANWPRPKPAQPPWETTAQWTLAP